MAKYSIGITEAGDAGVDLSWEKKLEKVDGAILITKNVSRDFRAAVMRNTSKVIVHATVTGFGGTVLEPNVPLPRESLENVMLLLCDGFPQERVVIRVGFSRYRISIIDMYQHVRERFVKTGLPLPYGDKMYAGTEQMCLVDAMLLEAKAFWEYLGNRPGELRVESCAEPWLKEPIPCGCISSYDLSLLGLDPNESDSVGPQRQHCMCYSGKKELLSSRHPCRHNCLYCYWKS